MKITQDLHCHSIFSDGKSSILDNIRMAEAVGLKYLAITDHYGPPIFDLLLDKMIKEVKKCSRDTTIGLLAGVEGTALDVRGNCSITTSCYNKIDIALVGIEFFTEGISVKPPRNKEALKENILNCYINLCHNPLVDVIAHPFNFGRFKKKIYPEEFSNAEFKRVAKAFVETKTIFEIMSHVWWWYPQVEVRDSTKQYLRLFKILRKEGAVFSVGSDAHYHQGVGNLTWAKYVIEEAGIKGSHIINPEEYIKEKSERV